MKRRLRMQLLSFPVLFLLTVVAFATAYRTLKTDYTPLDKAFYLTQAELVMVRPGLNVEITDWNIDSNRMVTVDFSVADDAGMGLDLNGVFSPGPIRISFLIGTVPQGEQTYVAYATRTQASPITGVSAVQPTSDSGGTMTELERGKYRYTFGEPLPADFDGNAVHSIGFYAERDLGEFEMGAPMADGVIHFIPNNPDAQSPAPREVVTDQACAQCHDSLRLHGRRHSVELCVMCHYPGVDDPDTGNTVNMPVMIHKIHMGEELPSVQAGTPYQIVGYRQSVHDYSTVAYPQDHRYCDTCHVQEAAQNEAYMNNPTRASCGACHDDVNFASGENHPGGPVVSDQFCSNCHFPEGELEFDSSILGAHTVPAQSKQLEGMDINIHSVSATAPGMAPTVLFTVINNAGQSIPLENLNRLRFLLVGPTTDYGLQVTEDALNGAVVFDTINNEEGVAQTLFSYTFETVVPADAEGSFAIGAEGRRNVLLNAGTERETTYREMADNPVVYFAVTDSEAVPRRVIVSDERCEQCHRNLELHGGNRHNATAYCQTCHSPLADDMEERTAEQAPGRSISFQMMIHRIHMGEELSRDYTIYGHNQSVHNFNEVRYPSARTNCAKCHEDDSWMGSQGVMSVKTEREYFSPMPPTTAACLGCHDSMPAAAHAYLNSAFFGEACQTCHGEGREFSVGISHAE